MNKSKLGKILLSGAALAILSGCVNTRGIYSEELSTRDVYVTTHSDSDLYYNMKINTEGFEKTNPYIGSGKNMPSIDNKEVKLSIKKVLEKARYYNDEGQYTLTATLKKDHVGAIDRTRKHVINYKLVKDDTKASINNIEEVIFNKDITSHGKTKRDKHFYRNGYFAAHRSGVDSLQNNFKKLTEYISTHE